MELQELLPPDVRRKAYLVFALTGALLTAVGVGVAAAAGAGVVVAPVLGVVLAVAVAVYGSLGASFGFVAGSNVPKPPAEAAAESGARRALVEDVEDIPAEPLVGADDSVADSDALS